MIINREWCMPNSKTFSIKPIRKLIDKYIFGVSVDPFANDSKIATITNDLDERYDTTYHMDATDFLKSLESNSVDTLLYDPPYCYDGDTEIFTKNGWKNIKEITYEDKVATKNEKDELEYHQPIEIIHKHYKGEMVSIESKNYSLFVTPNHRCWLKNSFYGTYHWEEAKDLFHNSNNIWFQKWCKWKGLKVEHFILPSIKLVKSNRYGEKLIPEKEIKMETWLKFLGLYLSEGCCKNNSTSHPNDYCISISQVKSEGRKKIIEVLEEMGYLYSTSKNDFRIYNKQLYVYLKQFGKSDKKYIPEEIKQLDSYYLKILLEYLMIGDGTHKTYIKLNKEYNKEYTYSTNSYFTNSKQLMNDVCEIGIKCGYCINVREKKKQNYLPVYDIHLIEHKNHKINKASYHIIKDYNDKIYCLTVPNSILFIKRKGHCFWCGNSPRQVSECYKALGKTVDMKTTQASYWSKQKEEIGRIVKKDGYVITCSWNSGGIGKKYGFEIVEILLVAHGGWHNDTIVVVEKKVE